MIVEGRRDEFDWSWNPLGLRVVKRNSSIGCFKWGGRFVYGFLNRASIRLNSAVVKFWMCFLAGHLSQLKLVKSSSTYLSMSFSNLSPKSLLCSDWKIWLSTVTYLRYGLSPNSFWIIIILSASGSYSNLVAFFGGFWFLDAYPSSMLRIWLEGTSGAFILTWDWCPYFCTYSLLCSLSLGNPSYSQKF